MTRDPRYDVLFEPVKIGPLTAPNRFFQVPHADGMGYAMPRGLAAMREVKAEGGWGVVCTGYCSIHPSSDDTPHLTATLWDAEDVRAQALMVEGVHRHGALAGVELWYGGTGTSSYLTRMAPLGVTSLPVAGYNPLQTCAMDRKDIRDFRRWHRDAAKRAKEAGFDILYVYATHGYLQDDFLSRHTNQRSDNYGGRLENRARLVRELIEETRDATRGTCAVAVRFRADEGGGEDGTVQHAERREMFSLLAEFPDLWDINITDWTLELGSSRFVKEAALEDYVAFAKQMTSKPVVGVGRFTSPDTMVRQIKRGVLDLIGAARPSIADPFLPKKIAEGRTDDIRECIGCNICESLSILGGPIRCTQNPTMGEEWRRGWHLERIQARLLELGIDVVTGKTLEGFDGEGVGLVCIYTGRTSRRAAVSLVTVTARIPNDHLYRALTADADTLLPAGIKSVTRIGDCLAPSTIAAAVYSGHCFARELDAPDPGYVPFKRERATV